MTTKKILSFIRIVISFSNRQLASLLAEPYASNYRATFHSHISVVPTYLLYLLGKNASSARKVAVQRTKEFEHF